MATSHLCLLFLLALLHGSAKAQATCGGTVSLSVDGTRVLLTSPGYPSNHLHNMRCEWRFSTNSTSGRDNATHIYKPRIMFMIVDMQLERNFFAGGCHDHLIFDMALRVCGTRNRSLTYLSRSYSTSMLFTSDGSVSGRGFKLYVWAYLECGGRRIINSQHSSGVINSPVFPDGAVPVDMICRWEILNVFRKKIQLSLSDHGTTHCKDYDLIAVNETRGLHQHLCTTGFSHGRTWQSPVFGLYFFLVVPLREISVQSFKMYYKNSNEDVITGTTAPPIDCSNLTYYVRPGENLTLQTPNYPDFYPHNLRCNIRVYTDQYATVQGAGGQIQVPWYLFFEAKNGMNLEYESLCRFDYLEINGVRYCRSYAERVGTITTANRALVRFRTDESNSRPGFEFLVTVVKQICDQIDFNLGTSQVAYFSTPNYPNFYFLNVNCKWTFNSIQVSSLSNYNVYVLAQNGYDIYPMSGCPLDYLTMNNGQRVCGTKRTAESWLIPLGSSIRFRSNLIGSYKGGKFSARVINTCGGVAQITSTNLRGRFNGPTFPAVAPNRYVCHYKVKNLRQNRAVKLGLKVEKSTVVRTKRSTNSTDNGNSTQTSPCQTFQLVATILETGRTFVMCGSTVYLQNLTLASNEVKVELRVNGSQPTQPSFEIEYQDVPMPSTNVSDSRCGNQSISVPTNGYYQLRSPGYPNYHHRLSCTWTLKTVNISRNSDYVFPRTAYSLFILLLSYDIEYHSSCLYDSLRIQGNPPICGTGGQRAFLIPNSVGYISFKSDHSVNSEGFHMSMKAVPSCGGMMTLNSTTPTVWLRPPVFSIHIVNYPPVMKCTWLVERRDGSAISVMPSRTDYQTACSTYTMHAWSPTDSSRVVNLCLGRSNDNWSVQFGSRVVISFAMRPNIARPRRPNVSVKVSRISVSTTPTSTSKTTPPETTPPETTPPETTPPETTPPKTTPPKTTPPKTTPHTTTKTPTTTTSPTTTTTTEPVVVPGTWSSWTPWTACSVTCGMGSMKRTRSCKGKHSGVFCVNKEGVKATKETETKNCFRSSCENASAKQKSNAINISFKTSKKLTKDVFFDYVFDIVAKAFTTSINTFCNKNPGKCCKPGDIKSYIKTKTEMLTYTKDSNIRVDGKSLRITTNLISMSIFVQPPAQNDLCSNIKEATVQNRKKRSTVADAKDPMSITALQEAAKGINTKQMGTDISANLKKNLNIDVKVTVTINTQQPTPSPQNNGWKAPVIVVVCLLVAAAIAVAVFLMIRKLRRTGRLFGSLEEDTDEGYVNPVYENLSMDQSTSHA